MCFVLSLSLANECNRLVVTFFVVVKLRFVVTQLDLYVLTDVSLSTALNSEPWAPLISVSDKNCE